METCVSLPFGDGLNCNGNTDPDGLHFTGKKHDVESGLDYFNARYYDENVGRFTSPDPLGGDLTDPQTLNKYSYVRNNPLSLTDPTGLDFHLMGCGQTNTLNCKNNISGTYDSMGVFSPTVITDSSSSDPDDGGQQSGSSGGGGFWSSLGHGLSNLLNGHSWGYVSTSVTAYTDNSNLKVIGAENPAVAYGTDAAGVGATLLKVPYVGPASALLNYANDPNAKSAITNGLSLLPGEGATWPTTLFVDGFDYGVNHDDPNVQPWKSQPFTDGSAPGGNYGGSTSGGGAPVTQFDCQTTGDC